MEKNIVEVVMNNKGEVIEKVADYIGVESFAKTIEELYRECLENFDDAEDLEEYIADIFEKNIQSLAWEFTHKVNREMKKYLHLNDQRMDGNFANLYNDYPRHVTGTFWATDYDGDDYYDLYPAMVARLDAAEDSEQANKDREYLEEWYFKAFGTYNIKYNFGNYLEEVHSMMEDDYDWEQIDSCWGEYYEDSDELIKVALEENGIKLKETA